LPLGVVHLLQISVISDILNPILQWQYLVVTRHDRDSAKLQSLRQVHSGDAHAAGFDLNAIVEDSR
jgi:hypothetical protein